MEKTKHTAALTTATANQSQLTITEEIDFQEGAPHSAPQHIHMIFAFVCISLQSYIYRDVILYRDGPLAKANIARLSVTFCIHKMLLMLFSSFIL